MSYVFISSKTEGTSIDVSAYPSDAQIYYLTDGKATWTTSVPQNLSAGDEVFIKGQKIGYNTTIQVVTVPEY